MPPTKIDQRSPKHLWDEQHRLLAQEPVAWVLQADRLIAAFELIASDIERDLKAQASRPHTSSVALMVAGFAVEVLIKALLIRTQSPLNSSGRFELDSHNLPKLSADAGLSLTDEENQLLERLQEFATWAGRYPIPLSSEAMRPRTLSSECFAPMTYHAIDDFVLARALIAKLRDLLPKVGYGDSSG